MSNPILEENVAFHLTPGKPSYPISAPAALALDSLRWGLLAGKLLIAWILGTGSLLAREPAEDSAAYTIETFDKNTELNVEYTRRHPVFHHLKPDVARKINQRIRKSVTDDGLTLEQLATEFCQEYAAELEESQGAIDRWYDHAHAEPIWLSEVLISIKTETSCYRGGILGHNVWVEFLNFDPRSGRIVELGDLFKPGWKSFLNQIGERDFRDFHGLAPEDDLDAGGWDFPNNRFALNSEFGFTKEGLMFIFDRYEVGCGGNGSTEICIPWADLKDWWLGKPHTPYKPDRRPANIKNTGSPERKAPVAEPIRQELRPKRKPSRGGMYCRFRK
jgi:hypothetical protein